MPAVPPVLQGALNRTTTITCSLTKGPFTGGLQDSHYILTGGMEKKLRLFNLSRPDAEPVVMEGAPSGIRQAVWFNDDKLILCACNDTPGISYAPIASATATVPCHARLLLSAGLSSYHLSSCYCD
jgi:hypothetical protein